MKLTAPPYRGRTAASTTLSQTTAPGFVNPNRQKVIASTGARSTSRANQSIYHLRCDLCSHDYGCNGLDIKARLCPSCQSGAPGEPLRERGPMFDFGV
jgi:hypothetical protein